MRPHHAERLIESVSRLAAEFLVRHQGLELITVTGTRLDKSGHLATIFLTVYPETAEVETLAEIRTWRHELRDFLDQRLRGHSLTNIDFALDARIKRD